MKFQDLEIIEPVLKALKDKNYTELTKIQEKAIPYILKGNDVLGSAQTGTGKTAAFAVPIIQNLYKIAGQQQKAQINALIVTPTRELAIQIDESIRTYGKYTRVKHAVIFGGVKQSMQVESLKKGVHILTATPGRLLDLIDQGFINLNNLKVLVLDEADRMLDMGFIHDIRKLLKIIPKNRQSLFFSATMPKNIVKLSDEILRNPVRVNVSPVSSTAETIRQSVYYTNKSNKKDVLLKILTDTGKEQILLFSKTKHGADRISKFLKKQRVSSGVIHGDKAQNHRQKMLNQFKAGLIRILVATDIAARGIDIHKLQYVVNFDIPNVPEDYVHRIGRSGRAGEDGIAISICEPEENTFIRDIEKLIKLTINVVTDNPFPQTDKPMTPQEKRDWEKEKQKRKQEFFANRKKKQTNLNYRRR